MVKIVFNAVNESKTSVKTMNHSETVLLRLSCSCEQLSDAFTTIERNKTYATINITQISEYN